MVSEIVEPADVAPDRDLVVDEPRMDRDRLERTRRKLREHQLPAALLFDPLNVRYAVAPGPFAIFNMHMTFRWALVPVESDVVLWEYPHSRQVTSARWPGDLREARGWNFFGSGSHTDADAARFAAEIAEELRARGLAGSRWAWTGSRRWPIWRSRPPR